MADSHRRPGAAGRSLASARRPQPSLPGRRSATRRCGATTARYARIRSRDNDVAAPWKRRLPLVIAAVSVAVLVVLAGTGILGVALGAASSTLGRLAGSVFPTPASPSPTPSVALRAPRLLTPDGVLSRAATADVRGMLPEGVRGMRDVRIRVYVNDRKAKEQPVGQRTAFAVRGVPLANGENEIRASLVGPSGEGERSNVIDLIYDVVAPAVTISDPPAGGVVNAESVTVRGTTEPGSTVSIRNATNQQSATGDAADGRFAITVPLAAGQNALTIAAVDRGENRTERKLNVVKGDGVLKVALSLSRTLLYRARLPETVTARVSVLDPDARPIDGARVTFSISPPGLPTSTFETTTVEGAASWTITVPREGAMAGKGFATVLVVLPDGRLVRDTVRFSFL